jgi:hypothetical protein
MLVENLAISFAWDSLSRSCAGTAHDREMYLTGRRFAIAAHRMYCSRRPHKVRDEATLLN